MNTCGGPQFHPQLQQSQLEQCHQRGYIILFGATKTVVFGSSSENVGVVWKNQGGNFLIQKFGSYHTIFGYFLI